MCSVFHYRIEVRLRQEECRPLRFEREGGVTPMQRRDFLQSTIAVAAAAELGIGKAQAKVSAHNWGNYDFGSGPKVTDRLNQGPFPQYPPDAVIPTDYVVTNTSSTEDDAPNYGNGL